MTVTCPGCNRTLNVSDKLAGKTVACPACKSPVKVEQRLVLAPEAPQSTETAAALGMGRMQTKPGQPGTCPGCGFPIPANKDVCNRCGYDRVTGQRDESGIGYQASTWQKSAHVRNKVLSIIVVVAAVAAIAFAVHAFRGWAQKVGSEEAASTDRESPKRVPPKRAARDPKAAPRAPAAAPQPVSKAPPTPGPGRDHDITQAFEEAYVLLIDPVPGTSQLGSQIMAKIGKGAVPHLVRKISESDDVGTRTVCIAVLSRVRSPDVATALIDLLADKSFRVRDAAVTGLVTQGRDVSAAIAEALKSENRDARVAAVRVISAIKLTEHTNAIVGVLKDDVSPEVRQEAALALGNALRGTITHAPLIAALDDVSSDVAFAAAESLAAQIGSIPAVLDALKADKGGETDERYAKLFLLGWPIVVSGDTAACTALAKRVCSEKPIPEVVKFVTTMLVSSNAVASYSAVRTAGATKLFQPPESIAALTNLISTDRRVRMAAEDYAYQMPEITFTSPLIAALGSNDTAFAISCARLLSEKRGTALEGAVKRAANGANLQRSTLASVVLALQGGDIGLDTLLRVAVGEIPLAPPVPGLAAYGYATRKPQDKVKEFFEAYRASGDEANRLYYCAAAARGGNEEALQGLRAMLSNTKLGGFRLEAARLLGELKDPSSHSGLVAMLREADDATQISAARSLARLDNEEIIAVLLDALPRLYDEARDEVRAIVVKAGAKAVPHVEAALRSDDPRVRAAALSIVAEWGRATPKPILTQLGLMLQDMRLPPQTSEAVKHAVVAATGITPKPDWTWREWVKACGVRPGALIESLELEDVVWDWVTMQVPKTWDRNRVSCSTLSTPGSPTISIMQRFDSVVSGHVGGFWTPQHKSLKDFAQNRIRALAMVTVGPNKWEPRATARVENTVGFSLGGYPSESFRIVDAETGRTTLYVLGWIKSAKTHWYLEVSFSAETGDYQEYKTLFETKVARSIRITPREIKLNSK